MSKRVTVIMDDDAAELLAQLAGSTRKQGAYLSSLIRVVAASRGLLPGSGQDTISQESSYNQIGILRLSDVIPYQSFRANLGLFLREAAKGHVLMVVRGTDRLVVLAAEIYESLVRRLEQSETLSKDA
jgi:prevent-host-death family protein